MDIVFNILSGLAFLIIFGSILFLAVVASKFVSGKARKVMKGRHINVVESVSIGLDKQLHLIKIAGQYVLIASAGKSVEFLTTVKIDGEEEIEIEAANENMFDFKSFFDKYLTAFKEKKDKKGLNKTVNDYTPSTEDEIFRNNLSRLRSINKNNDAKDKNDGDDTTNEK